MKKQSRRILSFIVCLSIVLSTLTFVCSSGAYAFFDTEDNWAKDVIDKWSESGVISGDGDGNFRPDEPITRAEFAKIVTTAKKYTEKSNISFTDVDDSEWYYDALSKSVSAGIINGYEDGSFRPNSYITRQEAAAVISRAYEVGNDLSEIYFTDKDQIEAWALNDIKRLYNANIISGYPDGSFMPMAEITRAETVKILDNVSEIAGKLDDTDITLIQTPITGPHFGSTGGSNGGGSNGGSTSGGSSGGSSGSSSSDSTTKYYNVIFVLNDGTAGAYEMQVVKSSQKATEPAKPERDLYKFTGWYTEPDTINKYDFSKTVNEDLTLYAGWGNPSSAEGLYTASSGEETIYSITSIEYTESTADVTINVNSTCVLTLEFYDENSNELLLSTAVQTPSYCEMVSVSVPINYNELPEHFIAIARMYDANNTEVCEAFKDIEKTSKFEEFSQQTIEDFDEEKVVNFDDDITNNFGVLADDVIKFESNSNVNTLVDIDGEGTDNVTYTFKNLDEDMQNLKLGNKVYFKDVECIFQISAITINDDGTVSYTSIENPEDPTELADYYDVIKVDTTIDVENANSDDEVSVCSDNYAEVEAQAEIIDVDNKWASSLGTSLSYKFNDNLEISGSLKGTGGVSVKLYYDAHLFGDDYFKTEIVSSLTIELDINVTLSTDNSEEVKKEFEAAKVSIDTGIPGLTVYVQPSIPTEWKLSASGKFTFKYEVESGFSYDTDTGRHDIDKKTHSLDLKIEGSAELKFGPKLEFGIQYGIPHTKKDDLLKAGISAQCGIKIKATMEIGGSITNAEEVHACNLCVSGEAKWFVTVDVKLSINISKKLSYDVFDLNILTFEAWINALSDTPGKFYFSIINDSDSCFGGTPFQFGFGKCPNHKYRTTIIAKNADDSNAENIKITLNNSNGKTVESKKSPLVAYLYSGTYSAKAEFDDTTVNKSISVAEAAQEVDLYKISADGAFSGMICDAETNEAISEATVLIYNGDTLVTSGKSKDDGSYNISVPDGTYCVETTVDGYIPFKEYATVSNGEKTYLSTTKLIKGNKNAQGGFSGKITNAVNDEAIPDVTLELREGWNNTSYGHIIKTLNTDSNGNFTYNTKSILGITIGLPVGNYTLKATKDDYATKSFNIMVLPNVVKANQDFSMSPTMSDGEYRIVLKWGENPCDLDSHLVGPTDTDGRFHIYFNNKTYYQNSKLVANLDKDDVNGNGFETTTIYEGNSGKYYFYVHHFAGSGSISTSDAQVTVYNGDSVIATYNAPINQDGLYWNVFVLDTVKNKLTPVNTMTNAPTALDVSVASDDINNENRYDDILYLIDADVINSMK